MLRPEVCQAPQAFVQTVPRLQVTEGAGVVRIIHSYTLKKEQLHRSTRSVLAAGAFLGLVQLLGAPTRTVDPLREAATDHTKETRTRDIDNAYARPVNKSDRAAARSTFSLTSAPHKHASGET